MHPVQRVKHLILPANSNINILNNWHKTKLNIISQEISSVSLAFKDTTGLVNNVRYRKQSMWSTVLKISSKVAWWMFSVRALGSKEGGEKGAKEVDIQKISILRTYSEDSYALKNGPAQRTSLAWEVKTDNQFCCMPLRSPFHHLGFNELQVLSSVPYNLSLSIRKVKYIYIK